MCPTPQITLTDFNICEISSTPIKYCPTYNLIMNNTLLRIIASTLLWCSFGLSYANPVALIVPTGPGGLNHKYALELEPILSKLLEQPVVIEFRPGGQGLVGAQTLAANKTPSLTLMLGAVQQDFAINQLTDIVPVLDLGIAPTVVIAKPSLGITSLAQLTKMPSSYTIGIPNGAAQLHWVREFSKNYKNISLTEVPYKSGAAVLTDVAGGHVDIGIASAIGAAPLANDGKVVVLATLSAKRSSLLPQSKTPREQGIQYSRDNIGFSHMFIWANPGADPVAIAKFQRKFVQWALTTEATELFNKIDLSVDAKNSGRPELSLTSHLQK